MEGRHTTAMSVAAIAFVVAVALINLPLPFFGDQALYSVMTSMMADGAVLYIDVWDIKQPGIFAFYLLAGGVFGFTEVGAHTLEIVWWVAFMALLASSLPRVLASPTAVAASLVFIGGGYFLVASPTELTQVEGLVGFPLFACLWFAYRSESPETDTRRYLALSGACGGIVMLFKLIFLPIVATLWLIALVAGGRQGGPNRWQAGLAVVVGAAIPVGLTAAVLASQGSLGEALRVSFVHPIEVLAVDGIGYGLWFLRTNITWFAVMFLPIHLLAIVGMWRAVRGERQRFDLYVAAWLVTGGVVILIQVSSGFTWHFLLLLVPLGLFAGRGIDWIMSIWADLTRPRRAVIVLTAAVALLPPLYGGVVKLAPLASNGFALSNGNRTAYEREVWPYYDMFRTDGAILDDPSSPLGAIHVFGDPTYHFLFGRDQAISIHGWTPQLLTDAIWERASNEIIASRPPFIHVAEWARPLVENRGRGITEFMSLEYEIAQRTDLGTWYVLQDVGRDR